MTPVENDRGVIFLRRNVTPPQVNILQRKVNPLCVKFMALGSLEFMALRSFFSVKVVEKGPRRIMTRGSFFYVEI